MSLPLSPRSSSIKLLGLCWNTSWALENHRQYADVILNHLTESWRAGERGVLISVVCGSLKNDIARVTVRGQQSDMADFTSTVAGQLTFFGSILLAIGAALVFLATIEKTRTETIHEKRNLVLDPKEPVFLGPEGTVNYLLYLNVMLPLSEDAEISGRIRVVRGNLRFRIVGYFGFPAPLGHGKWISNIFYPNGTEFADINADFELPKLRLLRRDYVCEFRVSDESNPQPFEVAFTATAKRKGPRFKYSEGAKDFGRLFVTAGISFMAVGISVLLRG